LTIDELTPNRTTGVIGLGSSVHNQEGVLILEGRQRYLVRKQPSEQKSGGAIGL
jgi:hypothetical protein